MLLCCTGARVHRGRRTHQRRWTTVSCISGSNAQLAPAAVVALFSASVHLQGCVLVLLVLVQPRAGVSAVRMLLLCCWDSTAFAAAVWLIGACLSVRTLVTSAAMVCGAQACVHYVRRCMDVWVGCVCVSLCRHWIDCCVGVCRFGWCASAVCVCASCGCGYGGILVYVEQQWVWVAAALLGDGADCMGWHSVCGCSVVGWRSPVSVHVFGQAWDSLLLGRCTFG